MSEWKTLWKDVDAFAAKSKQQFDYANEEIAKLKGWKSKGCPDGMLWLALHARSNTTVTAKSAEELVTKVRAEAARMEENERAFQEANVARLKRGER